MRARFGALVRSSSSVSDLTLLFFAAFAPVFLVGTVIADSWSVHLEAVIYTAVSVAIGYWMRWKADSILDAEEARRLVALPPRRIGVFETLEEGRAALVEGRPSTAFELLVERDPALGELERRVRAEREARDPALLSGPKRVERWSRIDRELRTRVGMSADPEHAVLRTKLATEVAELHLRRSAGLFADPGRDG